jgi:hypothetical protein
MPVELDVDFVWVEPVESGDRMPSYIDTFFDRPIAQRVVQFSSGPHNYEGCELIWNKGVLTGCVFKARSNSLPSRLSDDGPHPLEIGDDDSLGEGMCFAYSPKFGGAAVHYAHSGARYHEAALSHSHCRIKTRKKAAQTRFPLTHLVRAGILSGAITGTEA